MAKMKYVWLALTILLGETENICEIHSLVFYKRAD